MPRPYLTELEGEIRVREESSMPLWTTDDIGRVIYYSDIYYVGTSGGWEAVGPRHGTSGASGSSGSSGTSGTSGI